MEQPNIPPNWIWFLVSLHPWLYHTGTGVTWHSSWVCTVITLCLHVSIYILDCITLAVAWPDISHDFLSCMKIRLYLWFSCRWLGGIHKMITFFSFLPIHFEEIMCRFYLSCPCLSSSSYVQLINCVKFLLANYWSANFFLVRGEGVANLYVVLYLVLFGFSFVVMFAYITVWWFQVSVEVTNFGLNITGLVKV